MTIFFTWRLPASCLVLLCSLAPMALHAEDASGADLRSRCSLEAGVSVELDDFQAVDLSGRRWTGQALHGKPALIVFWATWCSLCIHEAAMLREIRSEYEDQISVIGVNLDGGDRPAVASFIKRHRIDWPQIHEGRGMSGRLARLFRVQHPPFFVLYGSDGRIVSSGASLCGLGSLLEDLTIKTAASGAPQEHPAVAPGGSGRRP